MAGFSAEFNQNDIDEVKRTLRGSKDATYNVFRRSLGTKNLGSIRTMAVKEIRKDINLKAKIVKATFKLKAASYRSLSASVSSKGKPVPIYNYGAKQTLKGVTAKIKKSGKRVFYQSAFIATLRQGHTSVFQRAKPPYRTKKSNKLPWKRFGFTNRSYGRLPIKELFGPRVPGIMGKDSVMKPILKNTGDLLHKALMSELNYELSRIK